MDGPIHAAPSKQGRICGIDDSIYLNGGDIGFQNFYLHVISIYLL